MNPAERFALTVADKRDAFWLRIVAHLEDRIDALRLQNEADLSVEKTAYIRGRIAEIKAIISLGKDQPEIY